MHQHPSLSPRTFTLTAASLLAAAALTPAFGAGLKITEAMSSSGGGTADWFELTNTDLIPFTFSGEKMDDNSFAFANSVTLLGVTSLAPGESAVFIETTTGSAAADIAAFRTFWGGIAVSAQIGSYNGSGTGVSLSSGGDGVVVFNSGGTEITPRASFAAATTGVSFGYDPGTSTFGALSADGVNGAYTSADALHNVGSPGAVPEPSALTALLGGAAILLGFRRRQA